MTADAAMDEAWSTPDVAQVAQYITTETGLRFSASRLAIADTAIRRAMARAVANADGYETLLQSDRALFDALLVELTVGETYFFREPAQFDFMRGQAIPELLRRKKDSEPLRVWSAGCASGEEPYSVAMLFQDMGLAARTEVLGTDICTARLENARRGRYGQWSLRGVPKDVVGRYFRRSDVRYELVPSIRSAVQFRYDNLPASTTPPAATSGGLDLILCRNVLIYFEMEVMGRIAKRFYEALEEGGWLFLGASDPPLADLAPFEVVVTGAGIAYRRPRRRTASLVAAVPSVVLSAPACGKAHGAFASATRRVPAPVIAGPPRSPVEADTAPEDTGRLGAAGAHASAAADHAGVAERDAPFPAPAPESAAAAVALARSLADLGRLHEAGSVCAAAMRIHATSPELACLHAIILSAGGDHQGAAAAARRAIYLAPGVAIGHVALGTSRASLGDRGGALRSLLNAERLLAAMPPDAAPPDLAGESAGRMLGRVRAQLRLLSGAME